MRTFPLASLAAACLLALPCLPAQAADDIATYSIDTTIRATSDQRTRGISDSLNQPALKLSVQAAHESGLIGLVELATVSRKEFLEGDGLDLTLAGGYRFGNPDAWHFGVGAAAEIFPDAHFDAPQAFDFSTGTPTDVKRANYDSAFAVLEIGYGALEGRVLDVLSDTYRGANTGGVCGTMLALMPDPTKALACYARGEHGSRGTLLFDLDYKFELAPATSLTVHGGYQRVANFPEANFADESVTLAHKRWGLDWELQFVTTQTKTHELYLVPDGSSLRATDNNKVVVSVAKTF